MMHKLSILCKNQLYFEYNTCLLSSSASHLMNSSKSSNKQSYTYYQMLYVVRLDPIRSLHKLNVYFCMGICADVGFVSSFWNGTTASSKSTYKKTHVFSQIENANIAEQDLKICKTVSLRFIIISTFLTKTTKTRKTKTNRTAIIENFISSVGVCRLLHTRIMNTRWICGRIDTVIYIYSVNKLRRALSTSNRGIFCFFWHSHYHHRD